MNNNDSLSSLRENYQNLSYKEENKVLSLCNARSSFQSKKKVSLMGQEAAQSFKNKLKTLTCVLLLIKEKIQAAAIV